jgi:hypothetical protein
MSSSHRGGGFGFGGVVTQPINPIRAAPSKSIPDPVQRMPTSP